MGYPAHCIGKHLLLLVVVKTEGKGNVEPATSAIIYHATITRLHVVSTVSQRLKTT